MVGKVLVVAPVPIVKGTSFDTRIEPTGSGVLTVFEVDVIVVPPAKPKLTKLASKRVLDGIVEGRS